MKLEDTGKGVATTQTDAPGPHLSHHTKETSIKESSYLSLGPPTPRDRTVRQIIFIFRQLFCHGRLGNSRNVYNSQLGGT